MTQVKIKDQTSQNQDFIANLPIRNKLFIITAVTAIPLAFLSVFYGLIYYNEYRLKSEQIQTSTLLQPITDAHRALRVSRPLLVKDLKDSQQLRDTVTAVNTLADMLDVNNHTIDANNIREELKIIINAVDSSSQYDSEVAHQKIISLIYPLFRTIAFEGKLFSNNSPKNEELLSLATNDVFSYLLSTGKSLAEIHVVYGESFAENNGLQTNAQKSRIKVSADELKHNIKTMKAITDRIKAKYPEESALVQKFEEAYTLTLAELEDFQARSLAAQGTGKRPLIDTTKYLPAQYNAFAAVIAEINQNYLDQSKIDQRNLMIMLVLLVLLSLGLFILNRKIISSITDPLDQLTSASDKLAQGNFSVRVPERGDELGRLSQSFNLAAAQLQENENRVERERREQEILQNNIGDFLDITMEIADGDLTKRGKVTEDALGNVVDSVNLMTESLGYVLNEVQTTSHSVNLGSQTMLQTTSQIQEGATLTANEVKRVFSTVKSLDDSVRHIADQAKLAEETAKQVIEASKQGQDAVIGTLSGMQNIRREVQGVAKNIKGLGDRSLEIQEIVDVISGIARQTNLLALNATIEAAGAGEAGGRFSIVADEVRKLADNSAEATNRIAQLIQNIQSEIQDVIINVEESTREVEQGYRIAGTAGERLRQIGDLTQRSAQLVEGISLSTQEQMVAGMEEVNGAVAQIAQIAQQSENLVIEGQVAAEQLKNLSEQLDKSLAKFRLPNN